MTSMDRERLTIQMLKQYQRLRHALIDAEDDIASSQYPQFSTQHVQTNSISNPTARGADRLFSLDEVRTWVSAIDAAMEEMRENDPEVAEILFRHYRMRYLSGFKHNKVAYTRELLMNQQHISRREYYGRIDTGITVIEIYAAERGLFRKYRKCSTNSM